MSVRSFKKEHDDCPIDYIRNKKGNLFFQCGSIIGHVSPAAANEIANLTIDDLNYALLEKDGEQFHCIMKKSTANVVKTM